MGTALRAARYLPVTRAGPPKAAAPTARSSIQFQPNCTRIALVRLMPLSGEIEAAWK
ncbi:hypothetical protein Pla86_30380 [Planctomycetes bacterium Pla86]|uniref:Uncharacterized protein n=1 Tax=Engelhardtia mirabilis TaxID=2528011 RepID=A0A518BLU3_9BACT|nr:hypothetical protein Pla133_30390 [Planctomycetes bacterium Pla133]QDV02274.1 hypothetical protein Pla86_30380 [Planctomycetes bacterium Pla86]